VQLPAAPPLVLERRTHRLLRVQLDRLCRARGLAARTLHALLERHTQSGAQVTVLSMRLADPKGYGRIVRTADGHGIERIVEENARADQVTLHRGR
jgi:tRNA G18 (ribose-2'-O)-methylase SpoU